MLRVSVTSVWESGARLRIHNHVVAVPVPSDCRVCECNTFIRHTRAQHRAQITHHLTRYKFYWLIGLLIEHILHSRSKMSTDDFNNHITGTQHSKLHLTRPKSRQKITNRARCSRTNMVWSYHVTVECQTWQTIGVDVDGIISAIWCELIRAVSSTITPYDNQTLPSVSRGLTDISTNKKDTIWLPQESLRHILASSGYVPRIDNHGKCHMDGKRNSMLVKRLAAYCTHTMFNPFWDIASYLSKIETFSSPTSV